MFYKVSERPILNLILKMGACLTLIWNNPNISTNQTLIAFSSEEWNWSQLYRLSVFGLIQNGAFFQKQKWEMFNRLCLFLYKWNGNMHLCRTKKIKINITAIFKHKSNIGFYCCRTISYWNQFYKLIKYMKKLLATWNNHLTNI